MCLRKTISYKLWCLEPGRMLLNRLICHIVLVPGSTAPLISSFSVYQGACYTFLTLFRRGPWDKNGVVDGRLDPCGLVGTLCACNSWGSTPWTMESLTGGVQSILDLGWGILSWQLLMLCMRVPSNWPIWVCIILMCITQRWWVRLVLVVTLWPLWGGSVISWCGCERL